MLDIFDRLDLTETFDDSVILSEDEEYASSMNMSMIIEMIERQLSNPTEYAKQDFMAVYFNLRSYRRKTAIDNDEFDDIKTDDEFFKGFMITRLDELFDISFIDITDISETDQDELIHMVYRYFVLHLKRNIKAFVSNTMQRFIGDYLYNYKSDITDDDTNNDIIIDSHPNLSEDGIILLHRIRDIKDDIMNPDKYDDIYDFLGLSLAESGKNAAEIDTIEEGFNDSTLTGNFIGKYLSYMMYDIDISSSIEELISQYIRKKFKKQYANEFDNIAI